MDHTPPAHDSILPLITQLKNIFQDKDLCKRLVTCQAAAQKLLDSFQLLLDRPELEPQFRRDLIIATQRVSANSGLHPTCYTLEGVDEIGQYPEAGGSFADVYKGTFHDQQVGIKAIRLFQRDQTQHALKKFWKEAMLWGQLAHPNVLTVYGLFIFQNRLSMVSPWMPNGDIVNYLKDNPRAPRALLAVDVGNGLSYLHENGVIHGDLKGPNILVDNAGRARLADFGISTVTDADIVAWTSLSSSGSTGGTVRWQAPELIDAKDDVVSKNSKESDVWELILSVLKLPTRLGRIGG
ncbi:hypothetical protein DXG01_004373 [Tephrocybe rancida]|nr:hypothetical protein DXG01_004373 [Tephrocybe rancida]